MDNENNNVTPEEPEAPDILETPEAAAPEQTADQVEPEAPRSPVNPEAPYQEPQFQQPQYQQPTPPPAQPYEQQYQQQYQQPYGQPYQQVPVNPGKGMSIASMVLGICGLVIPFFGTATAIVGLILGIIGKKKSQEVGAPYGMATAGIVCSIIGLACSILVIVLCSGILCAGAAYSY
jgi:hypothetical protein